MHVSHPTPKFEFRLAEGGRMYKIRDFVYKIVLQNYDPVFYVETAFGGCMFPDPHSKIWIADSARKKGVQNLGLGVQNCIKWVQNFDILFVLEIRLGVGAGDMHLIYRYNIDIFKVLVIKKRFYSYNLHLGMLDRYFLTIFHIIMDILFNKKVDWI